MKRWSDFSPVDKGKHLAGDTVTETMIRQNASVIFSDLAKEDEEESGGEGTSGIWHPRIQSISQKFDKCSDGLESIR